MKIIFSGASNENLNRNPIFMEESDLKGIKILDELLFFISSKYPETHESFFETSGKLKDGTLCIVDEQDWELLDCGNTPIDKVREVVLISSLHGG